MLQLNHCFACLSPVYHHLSRLRLPANIANALLASCMFDCSSNTMPFYHKAAAADHHITIIY
jgi:hypothetical protein